MDWKGAFCFSPFTRYFCQRIALNVCDDRKTRMNWMLRRNENVFFFLWMKMKCDQNSKQAPARRYRRQSMKWEEEKPSKKKIKINKKCAVWKVNVSFRSSFSSNGNALKFEGFTFNYKMIPLCYIYTDNLSFLCSFLFVRFHLENEKSHFEIKLIQIFSLSLYC